MPQRVNGTVRRLLQDKERFEELVEGMRWICKSKVPQSIGHQKMAEFVVDGWRRNRIMGEAALSEGRRAKQQSGQRSVAFAPQFLESSALIVARNWASATSTARSASSAKSLGPKPTGLSGERNDLKACKGCIHTKDVSLQMARARVARPCHTAENV